MNTFDIELDTEYVSWEESFQDILDKEETSTKNSKLSQMIDSPPLLDFLQHQKDQYNAAIADGRSVDNRWLALIQATNDVENTLADKNNSLIGAKCVALGQAIEALQYPSKRLIDGMMKSREEKYRKDDPLAKINADRAALKEIAQDQAKKAWDADTDKKLRTTTTCELIWPKLVDAAVQEQAMKSLPDNAKSIKDWIRPIAPDWVKQGGRPKK